MQIEFYVQNLKCNGCVNAIQTGLGKDPHVQAVQVDIPTGRVVVTSDAEIHAELSTALKQLGYPEKVA